MSVDIAGTVGSTVDSVRWPDVARVPGGPLSAVSGSIADRLLRRAAARLPLRLVYPDGSVVGAADPTLPTMVIHRPEALARRIGRYGLIGFGESYMAGEWSSDDLAGCPHRVRQVGGRPGAALRCNAFGRIAVVRPAALAAQQPARRPGATSPSTTTCPTTCSPSSSTRR